MADTAFQKQYRQEYIAGFEFKQSMLRAAVTTEHVRQGNDGRISSSRTAAALKRPLAASTVSIPARADNLTQNTATLVEWHDLARTRPASTSSLRRATVARSCRNGSIKVMNKQDRR